MRDNSPAEEESSSTSSKTMSYEAHAQHQDHNHATEQTNSSRDCNIEFALPNDTLVWFLEKGLQPPTRCHACRHRRKQATYDRSVTETPLETRETMPGINSTNEDHSEPQEKFDKDNKVSRDNSPSEEQSSPNSSKTMSNEAHSEHQDHAERQEKLTKDTTVMRDNSLAEEEFSETSSTLSKTMSTEVHPEQQDHTKCPKKLPKDHTPTRDNSPAQEQSSESSWTTSKTSLHTPNVESSSNSTKQSSLSRTRGRFWSSSSATQEMPMILPKLTDWSPIRDPKRRRNLEYTLSHPNRIAA